MPTLVDAAIRDGVLTPAGLRGGRAAEIIIRMGAVNQTHPEITCRFVAAMDG